MDIMTRAKFHFNRLMLTLIFGVWASEPPLGPGERLKRPGLIGLMKLDKRNYIGMTRSQSSSIFEVLRQMLPNVTSAVTEELKNFRKSFPLLYIFSADRQNAFQSIINSGSAAF